MAELETHSPDAAYATKPNIRSQHASAAHELASETKANADIEERLQGGAAGLTLSANPVITRE